MDYMVILTAIYVLATIVLVYYNYISVNEIRKQREESNRPIVECFFTCSRRGAVFRIENEGNLIAKNIQIRSDEPFFDEGECYGKKDMDKMMSSTFDMAPGEHFDVFLDSPKKLVVIDKVRKFTIKYESLNHVYHTNSSINFSEYRWSRFDPDIISILESIEQKIE